MKITEYKVVYGNTILRLEDRVSKYIIDGWQPLGNVLVGPASTICQAMVKYEKLDRSAFLKGKASTGNDHGIKDERGDVKPILGDNDYGKLIA